MSTKLVTRNRFALLAEEEEKNTCVDCGTCGELKKESCCMGWLLEEDMCDEDDMHCHKMTCKDGCMISCPVGHVTPLVKDSGFADMQTCVECNREFEWKVEWNGWAPNIAWLIHNGVL